MRQELVVGQSPCSRKLPGQCNGACSSVSENLETRDARHYYALKLFHLRVFSFCSPIWGGLGYRSISLFVLPKSPPPSYLCSRYPKEQKAWWASCILCSGLPGSFPGFWWPHSENRTLGTVSEACFKVNDILGNGETVSQPLRGRILVVSWQFCLWYNSDDILAFPVAGVWFTFLSLTSWLSFIFGFLASKNVLFHSESALG